MSAKKPVRVIGALAVLTGAGTLAWAVSTGRLGNEHRDDRELTIYGNVEVRQAELAFRVPGRLELMELDEGQVVHEGDALARLDTRTFDDDVSAAEATLAAQEAALQKLVAGPRPAEIARARAMVAEASAGVKNANPDFARTERLFEEGVLAQATLEDARAAKQAADARLFSANESLRLLVEGSRAEDIAMAEANVRAARARLSAARNARADAELFAPSDGVVISRVREPGSIVSPNDIVYVVALPRPVWVRAYLSEPQLGKARPGLEVSVRSDTDPNRAYRGRIGFVSPSAEFTPKSVETPELRTELVYRVRVVVEDADDGLRQGMPVTVTIHDEPREP